MRELVVSTIWATIVAILAVHLRSARRAARGFQYAATHDALTGLPNRSAAIDTIAKHRRAGTPFTLGLLDLDQFKEINDNYGHAAGDALLQEVGRRLATLANANANATVARLQGDEFALITVGTADAGRRTAYAAHAALRSPINVNGQRHHVGASVGIAVNARVHQSIAELFARADRAMYHAKNSGLPVHIDQPGEPPTPPAPPRRRTFRD